MKRTFVISLLITSLVAINLHSPIAFAAGIKKAGPVSSPTSFNTLLTGSVPPTSSIGKNGDVYIDVKNAILYGPKKKGVWPLGVSLKGNDGKNGTDGKNGSDGKNGADGKAGTVTASTSSGTPGAQGPKGDTGPQGETGPQGPKGDAGTQGPKGDIGPQGLKGDKGDKGDRGASNDRGSFGIFENTNFLTTTPFTVSPTLSIGTYNFGQAYLVRFSIYLTDVTQTDNVLAIGTDASMVGGTKSFSTYFTVSQGYSFRNSGSTLEFAIHGETLINEPLGTGGTFQVFLTATIGDTYVTGHKISMDGFYSRIELAEVN